jgi:hypothetical protein
MKLHSRILFINKTIKRDVKEMGNRKIFTIMLVMTLFFSIFSTVFLNQRLVMFSNALDDDEDLNSDTQLNVTVLQLEPRINWYDFQYNNSGTWESKLNQQIDINNTAEYRFIVNISSDQGWSDIDYVNITAWFDQGNEASTYNQTAGGNINLFLQYENTTGTANWTLHWPTTEVLEGEYSEIIEYDPFGSPVDTECYNLTFSFIPSYQFRHAPGQGAWNNTPGYNDLWSWNFNITVEDQGGYLSYNNPTVGETTNEFGVYTYTQIVSAGWPTIIGNPGGVVVATTNITLETRSNGNYSLAVDLDQLNHTTHPTANMSNTTVLLRGGTLAVATSFPGTGPLYLYGSSLPTYQAAENNGIIKTTNNVEYSIDIPLAQLPGVYTAKIYYRLVTEI